MYPWSKKTAKSTVPPECIRDSSTPPWLKTISSALSPDHPLVADTLSLNNLRNGGRKNDGAEGMGPSPASGGQTTTDRGREPETIDPPLWPKQERTWAQTAEEANKKD